MTEPDYQPPVFLECAFCAYTYHLIHLHCLFSKAQRSYDGCKFENDTFLSCLSIGNKFLITCCGRFLFMGFDCVLVFLWARTISNESRLSITIDSKSAETKASDLGKGLSARFWHAWPSAARNSLPCLSAWYESNYRTSPYCAGGRFRLNFVW